MYRLLPFAVAVLLVAAACDTATDQPPEAAEPARVVATGVEGSVTLLDPDGAGPEVLWDSSEGRDAPIQPVPGPDGETVVWSELADDGPRMAVHTGGETRRVPAPFLPFYSAFSPDGAQVAALGNHPDGSGIALGILDLGADRFEIVDRGQPYYFDWHPDGDRLAAHIGGEELVEVDPAGERTPTGPTPGVFQAPDWTPDGQVVAVTEENGLTASLVTLQATTQSLALVDPTSGDVRPIARVAAGAAFEYHAGTRRIAYLDIDRPAAIASGRLMVAGPDGGDSAEVDPGPVVAFQWSPTGEHLWFLTPADDGERLVPSVWDGDDVTAYEPFRPTATFLSEYLPFWDQYTRTISVWNPAGDAFTYAEATDDRSGTVWVQPLDGERVEIGDGVFATWTR